MIVVVKEDWVRDENIIIPTIKDTIVNLNEQIMIFTEKELELYNENKTGKKHEPFVETEVTTSEPDAFGVTNTEITLDGERQTCEEPVLIFNLPNTAAIPQTAQQKSYIGGTNVGKGVPSPRIYSGKDLRKKKRKVEKYKNDCPFFY